VTPPTSRLIDSLPEPGSVTRLGADAFEVIGRQGDAYQVTIRPGDAGVAGAPGTGGVADDAGARPAGGVLLAQEAPDAFGERLGSRVDVARRPPRWPPLTGRLRSGADDGGRPGVRGERDLRQRRPV
jgi:hypothetical protein